MPDNETTWMALSDKEQQSLLRPLGVLLTQAADEAVQNGNCYVSVGTTRKVDALVLTVHMNSGNISCYGKDIITLLQGIPDLLEEARIPPPRHASTKWGGEGRYVPIQALSGHIF